MKVFHTKLQRWILKNKKKTEKWSLFWLRIIQANLLAKQFLDIVVKNPRENKATYRLLTQQMTLVEFRKWHHLYMVAYDAYMKQQWKNAKKIEDVLQLIPNFSPWALKDRFGIIELGKIPTEFKSKKIYLTFLKKVYDSKVVQGYHRLKLYENDLPKLVEVHPEVKKIDWFDLRQRGAFVCGLMKRVTGKTFVITVAKQKYQVRFLCNPFSSKMVFKVQTPNRKHFILKMAAHQIGDVLSDHKRKESENQAIRADSPYSNAMMEFYLKLNKCPHAPNVLYYTAQYEAVLYQEETGKEFIPPRKLNFLELNNHWVKDANRLGIYINDVSPANFLVSPKKVIKIIDIGHAQYANPMTQGVAGLTFTFGNLCGQDYLTHFGVMSLED